MEEAPVDVDAGPAEAEIDDDELDEEEQQIHDFMHSPQGNIMRQILWTMMAGQRFLEPNMKLAIFAEWKDAFLNADVESEEDDEDPEVIALREFIRSHKGRTMRQILWCWESGDPYITPNMKMAIFAEWQSNYYNRHTVLATKWDCQGCDHLNPWTNGICPLCDTARCRFEPSVRRTPRSIDPKRLSEISPSEVVECMNEQDSEESRHVFMAFDPGDGARILPLLTRQKIRKFFVDCVAPAKDIPEFYEVYFEQDDVLEDIEYAYTKEMKSMLGTFEHLSEIIMLRPAKQRPHMTANLSREDMQVFEWFQSRA